MTENYIQIMAESLEKKLEVLDRITEVNKRQLECSTAQSFDEEAYDEIMDEKGGLIDEMNRLDDGFTSTYELIREEVQENPEKYRDGVLKLQGLVRQAVEKAVSVEAQEKRNKAAMEAALSMKRQEIKRSRLSTSAAVKYYNAVSKINQVDPQLMDKKK